MWPLFWQIETKGDKLAERDRDKAEFWCHSLRLCGGAKLASEHREREMAEQ